MCLKFAAKKVQADIHNVKFYSKWVKFVKPIHWDQISLGDLNTCADRHTQRLPIIMPEVHSQKKSIFMHQQANVCTKQNYEYCMYLHVL